MNPVYVVKIFHWPITYCMSFKIIYNTLLKMLNFYKISVWKILWKIVSPCRWVSWWHSFIHSFSLTKFSIAYIISNLKPSIIKKLLISAPKSFPTCFSFSFLRRSFSSLIWRSRSFLRSSSAFRSAIFVSSFFDQITKAKKTLKLTLDISFQEIWSPLDEGVSSWFKVVEFANNV